MSLIKGVYCYMVFGSPGCGKTTLAAALSRKAIKKNIPVFSNFPLKDCYKVSTDDIGTYDFGGNALVLIDEAGISYCNRDFKKFPKQTMEYLKLHRHYGSSFVFFSQGWDDCDKKIRDLCTRYFNLKKLACFSFLREVKKSVGIDKDTKQIIDEYVKCSMLFGGLRCFYRPRYYKYFDSWDAPELPQYDKKLWNESESEEDPRD